jgi:hypothetical protein
MFETGHLSVLLDDTGLNRTIDAGIGPEVDADVGTLTSVLYPSRIRIWQELHRCGSIPSAPD